MSSRTVQQIIDSARARHWAFSELEAGDGAALLFLNDRHLTRLAEGGAKIEGLVGTTVEYELAAVNSLLVALDADGVTPLYTTTYQDGYPLHLDVDDVPYVDTADALIARDPFGEHGGTPGFPLPVDFLRLIHVALVLGSTPGTVIPCDVINERGQHSGQNGRDPSAFIAGNRLVPVLPSATGVGANTGTRWFSMSAIRISYVPYTRYDALTDTVLLPALLCECLTADVAEYFAMQSKRLTPQERVGFSNAAAQAFQRFTNTAGDVVRSPMSRRVIFRG